jgi:hypothetical protein
MRQQRGGLRAGRGGSGRQGARCRTPHAARRRAQLAANAPHARTHCLAGSSDARLCVRTPPTLTCMRTRTLPRHRWSLRSPQRLPRLAGRSRMRTCSTSWPTRSAWRPRSTPMPRLARACRPACSLGPSTAAGASRERARVCLARRVPRHSSTVLRVACHASCFRCSSRAASTACVLGTHTPTHTHAHTHTRPHACPVARPRARPGVRH